MWETAATIHYNILRLGTAINRYSIVLIVLLVLIIALFLFFTKTQKGKVAFRRFSYPIPFFRNIYDKTASCRFAGVMSLAARAGSMDTVMTDIVEKYEDELDSRLNHMLSVLEPTLVIILSVIVGIILLSVMLPLMGIMSGL